jgi:hypothetical protein
MLSIVVGGGRIDGDLLSLARGVVDTVDRAHLELMPSVARDDERARVGDPAGTVEVDFDPQPGGTTAFVNNDDPIDGHRRPIPLRAVWADVAERATLFDYTTLAPLGARAGIQDDRRSSRLGLFQQAGAFLIQAWWRNR